MNFAICRSVLRALLCCSFSAIATAASSDPVRIAAGSDPAFVALYYASQQKMFEKAGLDVRLTLLTQAGDAMDGVVAGQYDMAGGSESTTIVRAERANLKALGVFWQSGSYIKLAVRNGITSPEQIKKIGLVPGSASELSSIKLFRRQNIDPKSVTQLPSAPPELPALLVRGDIDAFFLWEPWPSRAVKQGAKVLMTSGDVGYVSTMLAVASGRWLETNRDIAAKVMKVIASACDELRDAPEKAAQAVQTAIKIPAADALELMKGTECKVRDFGASDLDGYNEVIDFLLTKGSIKTKVDLQKVIEAGFIKSMP